MRHDALLCGTTHCLPAATVRAIALRLRCATSHYISLHFCRYMPELYVSLLGSAFHYIALHSCRCATLLSMAGSMPTDAVLPLRVPTSRYPPVRCIPLRRFAFLPLPCSTLLLHFSALRRFAFLPRQYCALLVHPVRFGALLSCRYSARPYSAFHYAPLQATTLPSASINPVKRYCVKCPIPFTGV
jgi:hypothetical protein